jgi:uncharacterized membrane protein
MMDEHPLIEKYLSAFEAALTRFNVPEKTEVAVEIRSHIAEALAEGKPLANVLAALGSAEDLARGYAVELTLNPRSDRKQSFVLRVLRLMGIFFVGSLVTFVVVSLLGTIGVGFTLSGLVMVVVAAIEAAGTHLPFVQLGGMPPSVFILGGAAIFAVGAGALYLLRLYVRFLVATSRRVLPRQAGAEA